MLLPRERRKKSSSRFHGPCSGSGSVTGPDAAGGDRDASDGGGSCFASASSSHLRASKGHVKSASISASGGRGEGGSGAACGDGGGGGSGVGAAADDSALASGCSLMVANNSAFATSSTSVTSRTTTSGASDVVTPLR